MSNNSENGRIISPTSTTEREVSPANTVVQEVTPHAIKDIPQGSTLLDAEPNIIEKEEEIITPDNLFGPDDKSEIDIEKIFKEQQEALNDNKDNDTVKNLKPAIPLSEVEQMRNHYSRIVMENPDKLQELYRDVDSSLSVLTNATETFSEGFKVLKKAIEKIKDPLSKFDDDKYKIVDTQATKFSKFADQDEVVLSGDNSLIVMTALTGGMRRINLLNSGFTITVRNIPMDQLNMFYSEMNKDDYEFGKQFGTFYYLFADLNIAAYVINNLLPLVICGSTYVHYKDREKLMKAIKFQDFHVILWAMGLMMYPKGTDIHFVCSEPDCQHITTEKSDLSKLRRNNTDLMNEKMIAHFKNNKITDELLEEYHKELDMDKTIQFEFGGEDNPQKWELSLTQASLYDHLSVGNDYIGELQKHCSLSALEQVTNYTTYNYYRSFRPWISEFTLVTNLDGKEKRFRIKNDPSQDDTINMLFNEFQANVPDFADMLQDYILATKISHICFYMPACPKCGKEPATSVGGYIPYDPLYHFFILALIKLLRGA